MGIPRPINFRWMESGSFLISFFVIFTLVGCNQNPKENTPQPETTPIPTAPQIPQADASSQTDPKEKKHNPPIIKETIGVQWVKSVPLPPHALYYYKPIALPGDSSTRSYFLVETSFDRKNCAITGDLPSLSGMTVISDSGEILWSDDPNELCREGELYRPSGDKYFLNTNNGRLVIRQNLIKGRNDYSNSRIVILDSDGKMLAQPIYTDFEIGGLAWLGPNTIILRTDEDRSYATPDLLRVLDLNGSDKGYTIGEPFLMDREWFHGETTILSETTGTLVDTSWLHAERIRFFDLKMKQKRETIQLPRKQGVKEIIKINDSKFLVYAARDGQLKNNDVTLYLFDFFGNELAHKDMSDLLSMVTVTKDGSIVAGDYYGTLLQFDSNLEPMKQQSFRGINPTRPGLAGTIDDMAAQHGYDFTFDSDKKPLQFTDGNIWIGNDHGLHLFLDSSTKLIRSFGNEDYEADDHAVFLPEVGIMITLPANEKNKNGCNAEFFNTSGVSLGVHSFCQNNKHYMFSWDVSVLKGGKRIAVLEYNGSGSSETDPNYRNKQLNIYDLQSPSKLKGDQPVNENGSGNLNVEIDKSTAGAYEGVILDFAKATTLLNGFKSKIVALNGKIVNAQNPTALERTQLLRDGFCGIGAFEFLTIPVEENFPDDFLAKKFPQANFKFDLQVGVTNALLHNNGSYLQSLDIKIQWDEPSSLELGCTRVNATNINQPFTWQEVQKHLDGIIKIQLINEAAKEKDVTTQD